MFAPRWGGMQLAEGLKSRVPGWPVPLTNPINKSGASSSAIAPVRDDSAER